ncbi:MAG: CoA pyrophosphatase [Gammaproteobacteria bacterium]|nr:CoA pyrophosphatase [Gammaproteobacteria bacterium]
MPASGPCPGRLDAENAEQAALRELEEEVGLSLSPERILGRLDDFTTRSGFVMTPVVVWGGPARSLTPNPGEVASIHRIPLTEFLRRDAPLLDPEEAGDEPVLRMPVGTGSIAAPTAALLLPVPGSAAAGAGDPGGALRAAALRLALNGSAELDVTAGERLLFPSIGPRARPHAIGNGDQHGDQGR